MERVKEFTKKLINELEFRKDIIEDGEPYTSGYNLGLQIAIIEINKLLKEYDK